MATTRDFMKQGVNLKPFVEIYSYIKFNPEVNMKNADCITYIRGGNDGTLCHTEELIEDCLMKLIRGTLRSEVIAYNPKNITYEIGLAHHCSVYGDIDVNGNVISGQIESFRVPVKVGYNYE